VDRVLGELRVGDMALYAVHGEPPGERAASADLDRIAHSLAARGLADDAHAGGVVAAGEEEQEGGAVGHGATSGRR
jgi:hypothetical protein